MQLERLAAHNVAFAAGLARELHGLGTFGEHGPAFDWDHTMNTMMRAMYDPSVFFLMAKLDHEYVGAVTGRVQTFYFSPKLMGVEDAWYVREGTPKRASIGWILMHEFVKWCMDEHKTVLVQSGDIAGIRTVGVDALYRRMGFTRFGAIYKYARE